MNVKQIDDCKALASLMEKYFNNIDINVNHYDGISDMQLELLNLKTKDDKTVELFLNLKTEVFFRVTKTAGADILKCKFSIHTTHLNELLEEIGEDAEE